MYRSTDLNCPQGPSSTAGKLLTVLDAVLVDGYTTAALTSITRSGTTATATLTVANTTLETGNWATISGCTGGDASLYNGTFQITLDSSTQFRYTMTGTPGGSAAGTPVYAKAGLGWTRPSLGGTNPGTNITAYLPQAVTGYPRFHLRVDDSGGTAGGVKEAAVRGYETMSDINTGTGLFPSVAQAATGLCWRKSTTTPIDATLRPWVIVGNGRTFYLVVNSDASLTLGRGFCGFGGFESFKTGDQYNCFINGWAGFNTTTQATTGTGLAWGHTAVFSVTGGAFAARGLVQAGAPVILGNFVGLTNGAFGLGAINTGLLAYPAPADTGVWFQQPMIFESAITMARGRLPGFYSHLHVSFPSADGDRISGVGNLTGAVLVCVSITNSSTQGQVHIDTIGPW